jgi:hypothetical protein
MIKRMTMALAAVPVAALMAGGGIAVAQAAGAPAGTAVVQQASFHDGGDACRGHQGTPVVMVTARPDRDHGTCAGQGTCDSGPAAHQQGAPAGSGMMTPAHHSGDCADG